MAIVKKSEERGHASFGWLDSRHTFSFGEYYDPNHMSYGPLRVINDDWIAPSAGFPMHGHAEMEIFSFVTQGRLAHRDSLGNGSEIYPGKVQLMHAGTGIRHSEFNPSDTEKAHLFQIWIEPSEKGTEPGYTDFEYTPVEGGFALLVSPDEKDGVPVIRQKASIWHGRLQKGNLYELPGDYPNYWVQVIGGKIELAGETAEEGDAIAFSAEEGKNLKAHSDTEVLVFGLYKNNSQKKRTPGKSLVNLLLETQEKLHVSVRFLNVS